MRCATSSGGGRGGEGGEGRRGGKRWNEKDVDDPLPPHRVHVLILYMYCM